MPIPRPSAPHNTTQFISENLSFCPRIECLTSTTIDEDWEGSGESLGNAHSSMLGNCAPSNFLGLFTLKELEKQETAVLGGEQAGTWDQATAPERDPPAECFLAGDSQAKGADSVIVALIRDIRQKDEYIRDLKCRIQGGNSQSCSESSARPQQSC